MTDLFATDYPEAIALNCVMNPTGSFIYKDSYDILYQYSWITQPNGTIRLDKTVSDPRVYGTVGRPVFDGTHYVLNGRIISQSFNIAINADKSLTLLGASSIVETIGSIRYRGPCIPKYIDNFCYHADSAMVDELEFDIVEGTGGTGGDGSDGTDITAGDGTEAPEIVMFFSADNPYFVYGQGWNGYATLLAGRNGNYSQAVGAGFDGDVYGSSMTVDLFLSTGADALVYVDDTVFSSTVPITLVATNGWHTYTIPLGSDGWHRIRLVVGGVSGYTSIIDWTASGISVTSSSPALRKPAATTGVDLTGNYYLPSNANIQLDGVTELAGFGIGADLKSISSNQGARYTMRLVPDMSGLPMTISMRVYPWGSAANYFITVDGKYDGTDGSNEFAQEYADGDGFPWQEYANGIPIGADRLVSIWLVGPAATPALNFEFIVNNGTLGAQPAAVSRFAINGDSISTGQYGVLPFEAWPMKLCLLKDSPYGRVYRTWAVQGRKISDMTEGEMDEMVAFAENTGDNLILAFGANDQFEDSAATFEANLTAALDYLMGITDLPIYVTQYFDMQDGASAFATAGVANRAAFETAYENGIAASINPSQAILIYTSGVIDPAEDTSDGVHPVESGHIKIAAHYDVNISSYAVFDSMLGGAGVSIADRRPQKGGLWTMQSGDLKTDGNGDADYLADTSCFATIEGSAAGSFELIGTKFTSSDPGFTTIVFNYADSDNYWLFGQYFNVTLLRKRVAGVETDVFVGSPPPWVQGQQYKLRVERNGSLIECYIDDVLNTNTNDADLIDNTQVGIFGSLNAFDYWKIHQFSCIPQVGIPGDYVGRWQSGQRYFKDDGMGGAPEVATDEDDPISIWGSDNFGSDVAQTDITKRPLLKLNALAGRDALLFDGIDDFLTSSGMSNSACTIVVVCQGLSTVPFPPRIVGQGGNRSLFVNGSSGGGTQQYAYYNDGTAPGIISLGVNVTDIAIVVLRLEDGGISHVARVNGVDTVPINANGSIDSSLTLGAEADTGINPALCFIGDALYYSRILTLNEIQTIENELNNDYGIF